MNAFQALIKAHTKTAGSGPDQHLKNWLFDIAWRIELAAGSRKDVERDLGFLADLFTKASAEAINNAIRLDRSDVKHLRKRPAVHLLP
jgi:hypothetical protein